MRARHRDGLPVEELGQELRAVEHPQPPGPGGRQFGIVFGNLCRVDDDVRPLNVRRRHGRRCGSPPPPPPAAACGQRRPRRNLNTCRSALLQHHGQRAHAVAADSDEMHLPGLQHPGFPLVGRRFLQVMRLLSNCTAGGRAMNRRRATAPPSVAVDRHQPVPHHVADAAVGQHQLHALLRRQYQHHPYGDLQEVLHRRAATGQTAPTAPPRRTPAAARRPGADDDHPGDRVYRARAAPEMPQRRAGQEERKEAWRPSDCRSPVQNARLRTIS